MKLHEWQRAVVVHIYNSEKLLPHASSMSMSLAP